jgi:transcriptional regulator with XRE-family HTH domain
MPKSTHAPPITLGERLAKLRTTLNPWTKWSRAHLAQEAQVSAPAIARLERTGSGTAANLATLARFYHSQGINLNWLFAAESEASSPYSFDARWADEDRQRIFSDLVALRHQAQDPFIQTRITMLLVQLLPRLSLAHRSAADLRHYQRHLPPVVATVSGWRTRAFNIPPYHYYAAGESVPQCGRLFEYLVDDSPPEGPFEYVTCLACAEVVSPH